MTIIIMRLGITVFTRSWVFLKTGRVTLESFLPLPFKLTVTIGNIYHDFKQPLFIDVLL